VLKNFSKPCQSSHIINHLICCHQVAKPSLDPSCVILNTSICLNWHEIGSLQWDQCLCSHNVHLFSTLISWYYTYALIYKELLYFVYDMFPEHYALLKILWSFMEKAILTTIETKFYSTGRTQNTFPRIWLNVEKNQVWKLKVTGKKVHIWQVVI
jgi:hypothetical protein